MDLTDLTVTCHRTLKQTFLRIKLFAFRCKNKGKPCKIALLTCIGIRVIDWFRLLQQRTYIAHAQVKEVKEIANIHSTIADNYVRKRGRRDILLL